MRTSVIAGTGATVVAAGTAGAMKLSPRTTSRLVGGGVMGFSLLKAERIPSCELHANVSIALRY